MKTNQTKKNPYATLDATKIVAPKTPSPVRSSVIKGTRDLRSAKTGGNGR